MSFKENNDFADDELTIANEALEKNEETMDFIEDGDSELYDDLFVTEKVVVTANSQNNMELKDGSADEVVENANGESDIEFKDLSADEIEEANKYAEDLAAFGNIDGALEKGVLVHIPYYLSFTYDNKFCNLIIFKIMLINSLFNNVDLF